MEAEVVEVAMMAASAWKTESRSVPEAEDRT